MTGRPHPRDFEQLQWIRRAACKGRDTKFWIATNDALETRSNWMTGLRICQVLCPVREECLEYALENEPHDLWGGCTPDERRRIRSRRRRRRRVS